MNLKVGSILTLGIAMFWMFLGPPAGAQLKNTGQVSSAAHVSAEMVRGKLNPEETRPGDKVALKLKEDVKSGGSVVLKKGAVVEGVVKSVKRVEAKNNTSGQAESMIEIEWLPLAAAGGSKQELSITLQSVAQVSPMHRLRELEAAGDNGLGAGGPARGTVSTGAGAGAGLSGAVGSALGGVAGAAGGIASNVGAAAEPLASGGGAHASGTANAALMSMPSVVAADGRTASHLRDTFGISSSTQLYHVGRGEVVSSGGSKHSLDIFTRMSNDSVITSSSDNFEISSGAQVQLLVGVKK